jgi:hypothetical protein
LRWATGSGTHRRSFVSTCSCAPPAFRSAVGHLLQFFFTPTEREDALSGQRAVPRGTALAATPAQGAGGGAGAAGERRVHREGANAGPRAQQAGGRSATQACVSKCRVTSSARCWRRCGPAWDPVLGLVVGSYQGCSEALYGLARAGGGDGDGDGEVAADGGAERARGAGDLHARRAPPLG